MFRYFFYQNRPPLAPGDSPWTPACSAAPPNDRVFKVSPPVEVTDKDRHLPLAVLRWVYPPPDWTRGSALDVIAGDAFREYLRGALIPGSPAVAALRLVLDGMGFKTALGVTDPRDRLLLIFLLLRRLEPNMASATFNTVIRNLFPAETAGTNPVEPNPASERAAS